MNFLWGFRRGPRYNILTILDIDLCVKVKSWVLLLKFVLQITWVSISCRLGFRLQIVFTLSTVVLRDSMVSSRLEVLEVSKLKIEVFDGHVAARDIELRPFCDVISVKKSDTACNFYQVGNPPWAHIFFFLEVDLLHCQCLRDLFILLVRGLSAGSFLLGGLWLCTLLWWCGAFLQSKLLFWVILRQRPCQRCFALWTLWLLILLHETGFAAIFSEGGLAP